MTVTRQVHQVRRFYGEANQFNKDLQSSKYAPETTQVHLYVVHR